jgi:WD40 repeat protein
MKAVARRARLVLLALPLLAATLTAQSTPQLVLSVGHADAPDRMVFVGNYLATQERSNVNVIDLASGLTVARLPQGSLVLAMDGGRAGDLLAVGTCGRAVNVWNVKSRTLVRRLETGNECAEAVAMSPDGAFVAASADGNDRRKGVQVWDLRTGNVARELLASSVVSHLAFSGDGRWLAAVDNAGKATVFEWPSARALRTFDGLQMPGSSLAVARASRDGRYFAWLDETVRVFDVDTGIELPERQPTRSRAFGTAAEFLDDGRLAYIDDDHLILLTLPDESTEVLPLEKPRMEAVGDGDVVIAHTPAWLAVARDGRLLGGTGELPGGDDTRTVVWNVEHARLRELAAPALISPDTLQWSRQGLIAWAGTGVGVQGWDDRSGRRMSFGEPRASASAIAFTSDGVTLAASGSSVRLFDAATGRPLAARDRDIGPDTGVSISADGSRLAFTPFPGFFGVFDRNFRIVRRLEPFDASTYVEHVAFSPDGRWIAADLRSQQLTLRVWPVLSSGESVTLHEDRVTYRQPPAFSADSRRLASFVRGTELTIWSTASWKVERTWTLSDTGRALAFAPEGSRLAIASDGEAAIWDAETGDKLVAFSSPGSSQMTQIAWSPDGKRVVTSADDGVLRFWRASDGG